MIGKTLGHYQITEKLGEGGMGVVYKARDTHLDRFAAIKVLPAEKVADLERKRRFVQEAKAASALNHPNIVHVYDIDQADGVDFIAMEYVDGKTLDQRIGHRGLRLSDALKYAVQIADALAKAHSAGIVHRDLKPTNIMVNEDGVVKVLDFGLAKLTEQIQGDETASTATVDGEGRPITEEGVIVGTVSYMSPEQAEGKKVDARSDIFSLGSVLYEMVTGQKAFQGTSKMSTLSAILHQEPKPVSGITPTIPTELARLINRCLRKDPARRFQHMDDVKVALDELKEESDSGALETTGVAKTKPRRRLTWAYGVAAGLIIAAVGVWLILSRGGAPEMPLVAVPLTSYTGSESSPSFSPDGSQVTFSWNGEKQDNYDIYVKQIGEEPPFRLTTEPARDLNPVWSPEGQHIAFLRQASPTAKTSSLVLISQRGGRERVLEELDFSPMETFLEGPYLAWTPDSKWIACPVLEGGHQRPALFLISRDTGEKRKLTSPSTEEMADTAPAFSPDGRTLAFARISHDSDLYLLRLGADDMPQGEPERIRLDNPYNIGEAWLPDGGEIVFGSGTSNAFGLWRMAAFKSAPPRPLAFGQENANAPAISRQGNRLAYAVSRNDSNIWRVDLKDPGQKPGTPVRLISSTRSEWVPACSPDGKRIAFVSNRSGAPEVWACDGDGSNPVKLTSFAGPFVQGPKWSPDSRSIAFYAIPAGGPFIYVVGANGGVPRRLTGAVPNGKWPHWSRDGQSLYFAADASDGAQIWKMPASGGKAVQITRDTGADLPHESPDGKFVYYSKGYPFPQSVWRVPVEGGEAVKVLDAVHSNALWTVGRDGIYFFTKPDAKGHSDLSICEFATGNTRKILTIEQPVDFLFDVSPDGRTILYTQVDESGSDLMLVENFR